jgi:hypothetical protein
MRIGDKPSSDLDVALTTWLHISSIPCHKSAEKGSRDQPSREFRKWNGSSRTFFIHLQTPNPVSQKLLLETSRVAEHSAQLFTLEVEVEINNRSNSRDSRQFRSSSATVSYYSSHNWNSYQSYLACVLDVIKSWMRQKKKKVCDREVSEEWINRRGDSL